MGDRRERLRGYDAGDSYGLVLTMIVVTIVFIVAAPEAGWARLVETVMQATTLMLACVTARARGRTYRVCLVVAVVAVLAAVATVASTGRGDSELSLINVAVVAVVPFILTRGLVISLRARGVDRHTVAGVLTLYLLIGMLCALLYAAVGDIASGPLFTGGHGNGSSADRMYFSFITQTTVGYGDLAPVPDAARAIAVLQALAGQFYLVTVVGLVIGSFGSRRAADHPERAS